MSGDHIHMHILNAFVDQIFDKRLVNFINIKTDVYLDFSNQELVSTGVVKPLVETPPFSLYGGDTYFGHNSVLILI